MTMLSMTIFTTESSTQINTLSLHDALPILRREHTVVPDERIPRWRHQRGQPRQQFDGHHHAVRAAAAGVLHPGSDAAVAQDRKSTRLNSSHPSISYAFFCLKKKRNVTLDHV